MCVYHYVCLGRGGGMRSIHIRVYSTCNFYFNSYRCRFLYFYFHMLSNQWDQVHHNSLFYYKMYNVQQNSFYKYMYNYFGFFFPKKKKYGLKKPNLDLKLNMMLSSFLIIYQEFKASDVQQFFSHCKCSPNPQQEKEAILQQPPPQQMWLTWL